MPEDQNYEGDIWNKEASEILKFFSWNQIGDHDMDIKDSEEKERGIDTLFDYKLFQNFSTGIILEAKCYKTDVFFAKPNLIETWIKTLFDKVSKIKSSEHLQSLYPDSANTIFNDGLIVIWFKDSSNYQREKIIKIFEKVSFQKSSLGVSKPNRIFVLENYQILRLLSIINHIKILNESSNSFIFHYPSDYYGNTVVFSKILSLEYLFSKFILGEQRNDEGKVIKKIVFYFGKNTLLNFSRLKSALSKLQFLSNDKDLTIYTYQRDTELRKIFPEIKKIFVNDLTSSEGKFNFEEMDLLADLPSWVTSIKYKNNE